MIKARKRKRQIHSLGEPVLYGVSGHVEGEEFRLRPGETLTVGRSRSNTVSLRRLKSWIQLSEEDREKDEDFLRVGSRHFDLTLLEDGGARLENHSRGGTRVDGRLVTRSCRLDPSEAAHAIEFGIIEKMELYLPVRTPASM